LIEYPDKPKIQIRKRTEFQIWKKTRIQIRKKTRIQPERKTRHSQRSSSKWKTCRTKNPNLKENRNPIRTKNKKEPKIQIRK